MELGLQGRQNWPYYVFTHVFVTGRKRPYAQSPPNHTSAHARAFTLQAQRDHTPAAGRLDAGLTVRGIEVDPVSGKFRVLVGKPESRTMTSTTG